MYKLQATNMVKVQLPVQKMMKTVTEKDACAISFWRGYSTIDDVLPDHSDISVTVAAGLLVVEAQSV